MLENLMIIRLSEYGNHNLFSKTVTSHFATHFEARQSDHFTAVKVAGYYLISIFLM